MTEKIRTKCPCIAQIKYCSKVSIGCYYERCNLLSSQKLSLSLFVGYLPDAKLVVTDALGCEKKVKNDGAAVNEVIAMNTAGSNGLERKSEI